MRIYDSLEIVEHAQSPASLHPYIGSMAYWCLINSLGEVIALSSEVKDNFKESLKADPLHWSELFNINDSGLIAAAETYFSEARREEKTVVSDQFLINLENSDSALKLVTTPAKQKDNVVLMWVKVPSPSPNDTHTYTAQTLRSINEGVITTNTSGVIEIFNSEAENLTGISEKDARGQKLEDLLKLVDERNNQPIPIPIEDVLAAGLPMSRERGVALLSQNNTQRQVAFNLAPIMRDAYNALGCVLIIEDISQKNRIESELQKIQKMDSLAMLSASIAHDFNNYLTSITGSLSLARASLDEQHLLYNILLSAERGTRHAKMLTDRLYSFSKTSKPIKNETCIKSLLEDTASFILHGTSTQWNNKIPKNLWVCYVDEGQLSQVLNNLLINASQSMPDGGSITLQARNREMLWDPSLNLKNGSYVEIKIQDEGCGIAQEHMHRLFEPYFTTKPKGNGLGLATVYSIIKSHDGHIEVFSRVGKGTTFTLYLPADPNKRVAPKPSQKIKIHKGSGRILVMDDEDLIQEVSGEILKHLGYEAAFCRNGEGAFETYKKAKEAGTPFDLVIMDYSVVHGCGGPEALKLLKNYDPQVKAILASGYANHDEMRNCEDYGFQGSITKPYNIEQLSWCIQHAFNKTPS